MIRAAYNRVRPHLPRKVRELNGVEAPVFRLLDTNAGDLPSYEAALLAGIRSCADVGDRVVVVGGGFGVSAVVAWRQGAAPVLVFEPGDRAVEHTKATVEWNGCRSQVAVVRAAVGDPSNVWGSIDGAAWVPATAIPPCDVLVLDCEGAEAGILGDLPLDEWPRCVVVEFHDRFDSPRDAVRAPLDRAGYTVEFVGWEIESDGIGVLAATREAGP